METKSHVTLDIIIELEIIAVQNDTRSGTQSHQHMMLHSCSEFAVKLQS